MIKRKDQLTKEQWLNLIKQDLVKINYTKFSEILGLSQTTIRNFFVVPNSPNLGKKVIDEIFELINKDISQ